jgi:phenylacetate-coenzyme A ligase PaaK-like adenylate-forming protein
MIKGNNGMGTSSNRSGIDTLKQRSRSWLLRNVILPFGDLAFGQRMMKRLRFLEEAQWWDMEHLYGFRDRSLVSLMEVAYQQVPFYRELMDHAGVKPGDIRHPKDLYKLPIVTKQMLRSGYPHLTTRDTGGKTFEVCSSGSTGTNFCVREDAVTAGWHRASFLLALEWAGWQIGEPHLQTGMTLKRGRDRWLKDLLLQCHYVSAFDLSDSHLDLSLELLENHSIQHLWGYPGSLYVLARRALERGWNQPLRSIVTWGDSLYPEYRRAIESAFKARVFDTYGCGEGIQVAAQCGSANTYHLHTLDVAVEHLDDNGHPVRPGQPGNLILTRLHPGPMPLIRYQVGDVGIKESGRSCECGRGYDVMGSIQGRDTDIVITPSGNRLIVHFFTGVLEHFPEIDSFQVVQEELGSIVLRLMPAKGFSKEAAARIVSNLQEKGASDIAIKVEVVTEIPLPASRKRRFVVSSVAKPFV